MIRTIVQVVAHCHALGVMHRYLVLLLYQALLSLSS